MNLRCENCGQPAQDSDSTCWHCGEPLPGREQRRSEKVQAKEHWGQTASPSMLGIYLGSTILVVVAALLVMRSIGRERAAPRRGRRGVPTDRRGARSPRNGMSRPVVCASLRRWRPAVATAAARGSTSRIRTTPRTASGGPEIPSTGSRRPRSARDEAQRAFTRPRGGAPYGSANAVSASPGSDQPCPPAAITRYCFPSSRRR